jgi:predicted transcriptional regulator
MTSVTITLPDDRVEKLRETAGQLKISPEDLVRISIEDLLTRLEAGFQEAMD